MARQKDDNFSMMRDTFLMAPWWAGPVVAAVTYVLITYVLTPLIANYPSIIARTLAPSGPLIATFAGIAVPIASTIRQYSGHGITDKLPYPECLRIGPM